MAGLIIHKEKREPYWIKFIHNRIKKKKNFLCITTGPTGSGKSWVCLSIASMLDKSFNASRVVFGLRGLMQLINDGEKYKPGTVFIWDEFQIDASSRSWQSLTNRLLNSLFSTFRHKNFILLINAPYGDFIDSNSRKLLHAEWEVVSIDYQKQESKIKPMTLQYNSKNRKTYYKYLRVHKGGEVQPVKAWNIPKPAQWLIDDYEELKSEFTSKLNRNIETQLDQLEAKEKGEMPELTDKQANILELMKKFDDANKVAKEVGIGERTVWFHLAQAKKKGYTTDNYVEKGGIPE